MVLANLLEASGLTQTEMASRAGVAQTTVSGWQRGASLPPSTRLPALAAALGMPVADLATMVARERKARLVAGGRRAAVVGRGSHGVRSCRKHGARAARRPGQVRP